MKTSITLTFFTVLITLIGCNEDHKERAKDNKEIIRNAFMNWQNGSSNFFDLLADDVTWKVSGNAPYSGTYRSKDEFMTKAVAPINKSFKTPLKPELVSITAEGSIVWLEWKGVATRIDGEQYTNEYAWKLEMANGKIQSASAFLDTYTLANLPGGAAGTEEETVKALHTEWILVGWEKAKGEDFQFDTKLGKYYSKGSDLILYDDFDKQHRMVREAKKYGEIWEPNFKNLARANHRVSFGPEVLVSGDLATSTLQFEARLETKDGKVTAIRTWSSMAFRKIDGKWRIVREHNSSVIIDPEEVETLKK